MARISWLVPPPVALRPPRPRSSAPARPTRHHRTVFISDVHLGTRGCKAEMLLDFLQKNSSETLYLIGDIVDGWQLKRRWFWPESHSEVVHEILRKVDEGTRVIFVPGNHDEFLRGFCGRNYAGIEVVRETIHETGDGKRLLVLHGDQFDGVIEFAKWLAHLGSWAYDQALRVNEVLHSIRRALGLPYWSLSNWLKHAVKDAVEYVCRFEEVVARAAASRELDGVVCGHIHQAAMRRIGDVLYLNDGDWVESCTALVEDANGHLEIVRWAAPVSAQASRATATGEAAPVPA
ncbi:MAG: UDP-2,3-diacylglucosamine diphosphatase [Rhizomicrobium sp.]